MRRAWDALVVFGRECWALLRLVLRAPVALLGGLVHLWRQARAHRAARRALAAVEAR